MSRRFTNPPSVAIPQPGVSVPPDVDSWLTHHGWSINYIDGERVFSKKELHDASWEQAVAYEFFLFISLGGRNGQDAS